MSIRLIQVEVTLYLGPTDSGSRDTGDTPSPLLGAPEAEIFVFKFLPWPGFEPRTSQSNGRKRYHSTTAPPQGEA